MCSSTSHNYRVMNKCNAMNAGYCPVSTSSRNPVSKRMLFRRGGQVWRVEYDEVEICCVCRLLLCKLGLLTIPASLTILNKREGAFLFSSDKSDVTAAHRIVGVAAAPTLLRSMNDAILKKKLEGSVRLMRSSDTVMIELFAMFARCTPLLLKPEPSPRFLFLLSVLH